MSTSAILIVLVSALFLGYPARRDTGPTPTKITALDYPCLALKARIEGVVVVDCRVDQSGTCSQVVLRRGHPLLAKQAMDNVREWHFSGGSTAILRVVRLTYSFEISSATWLKGDPASHFTFEYPNHVVVQGMEHADRICPPPYKTDLVL